MVNWMKFEKDMGQMMKDIDEIKGLMQVNASDNPVIPEVKIDYDILAQKIVDRLKSQEVP